MSAISTTFNLIDRMSAPLSNITNSLNAICSGLDRVDNELAGAFDTADIDSARRSLDLANAQIQEIQSSIDRARQSQDRFNDSVRNGGNNVNGLSGKVKGLVGAYAGLQGLKAVVNLSDEYTQTTARLNLMNDGLQTTSELWDKIYASAQRSRTGYLETADVVAKLGQRAPDAFSSNDETIQFAENLNKMFVIAGASQQEISSASLQLTQALGSGILRGEEFNAVFEAAPNVMQTIADSMGVPIGELRNLASEGQITADVVKNALLGATDDINSQFESMPMTWAQVWQGIVNAVIYASQPLLKMINAIANHWGTIEPVVQAVAAALAVYLTYLSAIKAKEIAVAAGKTILCFISYAHAAATGAEVKATAAATAAQYGFNTALLTCPITWIVGILMVCIAALVGIVHAINKVKGTSISATGLILGAIFVAVAYIKNQIFGLLNFIIGYGVSLWNLILSFADFFANVFDHPVQSIIHLFGSMLDFILSVLQSAANAIDTVFGSNLSGAIQGWRDGVSDWVKSQTGDITVHEKLNVNDYLLGRTGYKDAALKGYDVGANLFSTNSTMPGFDTSAYDTASNLADQADSSEQTANNTAKIAENTSKSKDELKYLREIAERQVINKFTTAEIKVDMSGMQNTVNSDMDIDGFVRKLEVELNDSMQRCAQGV